MSEEAVSRRAREAAARLLPVNTIAECERLTDVKRGRADNDYIVQAFARFERELCTNKDETLRAVLADSQFLCLSFKTREAVRDALTATKKEG